MNELEKSILKTIIYFDIFNHPLSPIEIFQYLIDYKSDFKSIIYILETSENLKRYIEFKNGFYFLRGKKNILEIRNQNRLNSEKKIRLAVKTAQFIRYIPFIKCVCLSGSIPHFNTEKNSDIDFFIVIKIDYLWFSRFFVTIISHILGRRRHGRKIKDRLCLNFYLTDENLNLENLCYEDELWFYFWFTQIFPILGKDEYRNFIKQNQWILKRLPNFIEFNNISDSSIKESGVSQSFKKFFEIVLDNDFGRFLDYILREIQIFKMSFNKKSKRNNGGKEVIVNDRMLKFHETDPRKYYNKIFLERTKFLSKND
ncbi:MAG: hypothetical protein PHH83_00180 [Patescibacteria group bacterium]|nr:hypothetical protein [Patescibacteria group bacterium]